MVEGVCLYARQSVRSPSAARREEQHEICLQVKYIDWHVQGSTLIGIPDATLPPHAPYPENQNINK